MDLTSFFSPATSLIGAGIDAYHQRQLQQQQFENQKKLAAQQQEYNISNFRRAAQWNSEGAVAGRKRAAGLNIAGDAQSGSMAAPVASQGSAAGAGATSNFAGVGQSVLASMQLAKQSELIDSEIRKNDADAANTLGNTPTAQSTIQLNRSLSGLHTSTAALVDNQNMTESSRRILMDLQSAGQEVDNSIKRLQRSALGGTTTLTFGDGTVKTLRNNTLEFFINGLKAIGMYNDNKSSYWRAKGSKFDAGIRAKEFATFEMNFFETMRQLRATTSNILSQREERDFWLGINKNPKVKQMLLYKAFYNAYESYRRSWAASNFHGTYFDTLGKMSHSLSPFADAGSISYGSSY